MSGFNGTQREILLIEDNPGDVLLAEEAFEEAKLPIHLSVVRNGEDASAFLRREGRFASAPRPDLILLDLNLPRKDGRELLSEIKREPIFRRIPVIVLTTSNSEWDIARSYDLHANCYIIKPIGIDALVNVIRAINEFWFTVTVLPPPAHRTSDVQL
jgi:CheY-like chemotaxis protein